MFLRGTGLETFGVEAGARTRVTTGSTSFTTTHGVIDGIHDNTTVVGATAEPAAAACFTGLFEGVFGVADNTYGSLASGKYFTCFA